MIDRRMVLTPTQTTPVLCIENNCRSEDVYVETKATHISNGPVYHGLNGYVAENSDDSWAIEEGTEQFVCYGCGKRWDVDADIHWEWND